MFGIEYCDFSKSWNKGLYMYVCLRDVWYPNLPTSFLLKNVPLKIIKKQNLQNKPQIFIFHQKHFSLSQNFVVLHVLYLRYY